MTNLYFHLHQLDSIKVPGWLAHKYQLRFRVYQKDQRKAPLATVSTLLSAGRGGCVTRSPTRDELVDGAAMLLVLALWSVVLE